MNSPLDPFNTQCYESLRPRFSTDCCTKPHFSTLHRCPFLEEVEAKLQDLAGTHLHVLS